MKLDIFVQFQASFQECASANENRKLEYTRSDE